MFSVAPDVMHHVKTYRDDLKNMHCVAPECGCKISLISESHILLYLAKLVKI